MDTLTGHRPQAKHPRRSLLAAIFHRTPAWAQPCRLGPRFGSDHASGKTWLPWPGIPGLEFCPSCGISRPANPAPVPVCCTSEAA